MLAIELQLLACTLVLAIVQIFLAAGARTRETGLTYNASPRDAPAPPPGPLAGRLMRAQANLFETLPIFAAAVLIAELSARTGLLTALGAHLYFCSRLLYVPLYAFGVTYVRSLVWFASLIGIGLILAALLIPA